MNPTDRPLPLEERLLLSYFGDDPARLADARARLAEGEPLAYILGETVFFRETYTVTPDVLIPRPDSERVVEALLEVLLEISPAGQGEAEGRGTSGRGRGRAPATFLDLCTGSGCLAISALAHCPRARAIAVDISREALAIALENAARNSVAERVTFERGDIFSPGLWERLSRLAPFRAVVSNPPYVRTSVLPTLDRGCSFEPRAALDGGEDGLRFFREILSRAPALLSPGGSLVLEIGYDQRGDIEALARERRLSCSIRRDYGGNDRVAILRKEHFA